MKLAAVVVTFNRAELLKKTLDGLKAQSRAVDHVVVVNNASTDHTREVLETYDFGTLPHSVYHLRENTGGAGGFCFGLERAYRAGFDGFWLMDDDTVPQPAALAELEKATLDFEQRNGFLPSFACSSVLWTDGGLCEMNTPVTTWDWPRDLVRGANYALAKSCSFVSCMVYAPAVEAVGLPYSQYFIWYDDAEYTQRLSKFRPGIYALESRVDHLLPQNRGVNFGDLNEDNYWKFSRGVRNQVSAAISLRRPLIALELFDNMLRQWRGSSVSWKLRGKLVGRALSGLAFNPRKRFVPGRDSKEQ